MAENGIPLRFPPIIPPPSGNDVDWPAPNVPAEKPAKEEPEEKANYGWGFLTDLFAWWRTRRERKLIEQIRYLKSTNALLTEENWQQACLIERLNRWVQASTIAAARIAEGMGAPPPPPTRR